jgi:hypothetical protein
MTSVWNIMVMERALSLNYIGVVANVITTLGTTSRYSEKKQAHLRIDRIHK